MRMPHRGGLASFFVQNRTHYGSREAERIRPPPPPPPAPPRQFAASTRFPDTRPGPRPGHEIEHPMAVVILGGLITSTVLNLLLLPGLYLRFGRGGGRSVVESPGV